MPVILRDSAERERRRSRTYQPWGYHGLPVLKTDRNRPQSRMVMRNHVGSLTTDLMKSTRHCACDGARAAARRRR